MRPRRTVLVIAALLALAGCAGAEFQPAVPDELKPGPGLFSGEAGRFFIHQQQRAAEN